MDLDDWLMVDWSFVGGSAGGSVVVAVFCGGAGDGYLCACCMCRVSDSWRDGKVYGYNHNIQQRMKPPVSGGPF